MCVRSQKATSPGSKQNPSPLCWKSRHMCCSVVPLTWLISVNKFIKIKLLFIALAFCFPAPRLVPFLSFCVIYAEWHFLEEEQGNQPFPFTSSLLEETYKKNLINANNNVSYAHTENRTDRKKQTRSCVVHRPKAKCYHIFGLLNSWEKNDTLHAHFTTFLSLRRYGVCCT